MKLKARVAELQETLLNAENYEEWLASSEKLDTLLGFDRWKQDDESPLYDAEGVRAALAELRAAQEEGDMHRLLYIVRTSFSRNVGNMGDPLLYLRTHCGTKRLVEQYISECESAIKSLMAAPELDPEMLLQTLLQTRRAFGRTALVLSGGSTLGLIHAGVLYELHKQRLLPRIVSGSSAGAIVASVLCIHRDDELDEPEVWKILDDPPAMFGPRDHAESFLMHLRRFLKAGTWIDSSYLREALQSLLGDITFSEAYNRTGRILNVTVSVAGSHEMPGLLNYLTAPNVLIWSAVAASCSVPLVFASNTLMCKEIRTKEMHPWSRAAFIDGSVDNDMPLERLAEMFNVNHFIACQVNPHVVPLLKLNERVKGHTGVAASMYSMGQSTPLDPGTILTNSSSGWLSTYLIAAVSLIVGEVSHALLMANRIGILPRTTSALVRALAQDYIGNITILPEVLWSDFSTLFANPTVEQSREAMRRGRRATWPKIAITRNHCAIELALDLAIISLRVRLISPTSNISQPSARHARSVHRRRHSEDMNALTLSRRHSDNTYQNRRRASRNSVPASSLLMSRAASLVDLRRVPSSPGSTISSSHQAKKDAP